jgi:hypothetical protein
MRRARGAVLLACLSTVGIGAALMGAGLEAASASVSAAKPSVTCKQLTKDQVQPLMSATITSVKVTPALNGQQCEYVAPDGDGAVDVIVAGGSQGAAAYKQEVKGLDSKVAVPGVGDHAYRAGDDFTVEAIKGQTYCSVTTASADTIKGVGDIQAANGGSSTLPDEDYAIMAKALGTLCNRIYKSGTTTASLDGLSAPTTTT